MLWGLGDLFGAMVVPVGIISDGMTLRYNFVNKIFFRLASLFETHNTYIVQVYIVSQGICKHLTDFDTWAYGILQSLLLVLIM